MTTAGKEIDVHSLEFRNHNNVLKIPQSDHVTKSGLDLQQYTTIPSNPYLLTKSHNISQLYAGYRRCDHVRG